MPPRAVPIASALQRHVGWLKTPLAVLTDYELNGSELDGAKLDAELSFPGQIKNC